VSIQLNLAHVPETKQTKQCPFNSVQVKIREVSPEVAYIAKLTGG